MDEESNPRDHPELVVFTTAKSVFEARIIVAVLADAGIPAFVPGGQLQDEFALSQRLMNLQSVAVHVPADRLEDAERVLADAKATGAVALDEGFVASAGESEVPPPPRSEGTSRGGGLLVTIVLAVLVALFALLWIDARAQLAGSGSHPLWIDAPGSEPGEVRSMWRDSGKPATVIVDRDLDSIPERHEYHNRSGIRTHRTHDADEDGLPEVFETFDASGAVVSVATDLDRDGWIDEVRDRLPGGITHVWTDTDADRLFDRVEIVRGATTLRVQERRGEQGFVDVR